MKAYIKRKALEKTIIRKNKSQNWLAYRLGISSGYMSQLMQCSRSPSSKVRQNLLSIFPEYGFDDLFVIKNAKK